MPLERRGPFLLLFAVGQQLSALLARTFADCPLGPGDFAVTSVLALTGPIRPSALAEHTGLRPTTLSNYLRRFEEAGLVVRRPDPADGRASLVSLSEVGTDRTTACYPAFERAIGAFRSSLAAEGLDEDLLLQALESTSRALGAAAQAPEAGRGRGRPAAQADRTGQ